MSAQPFGSIYGFGQQPQFDLATAGQGVGAPGYNSSPSPAYAMPDYSGISSFGSGSGAGGGGIGGWLGKDGNLATVFGGIQALGGAYLGFQQLRQAKEALNFQKKAYSTNLANSTKSYNTSLEDRINGRTADYAGKDADVQAYLAAHQLKTS